MSVRREGSEAPRIMYIVANPFSYERRPFGGNIASANGIIKGFLELNYQVDILTDSPIPGLDLDHRNLTVIPYYFAGIRKLVPLGSTGFLGRVARKFDQLLFTISSFFTISYWLKRRAYTLVYMRASFNGAGPSHALRLHRTPLILEVNKPLSMAKFNNEDAFKWPSSINNVSRIKVEQLQYSLAKTISVDSTLRAKWITDFVDASLSEKIFISRNGVDCERFFPVGNDSKADRVPDVERKPLIVGMASSFRWYNDIDELMAIIRRVVKDFDRCEFRMIVGDKQRSNYLRKKVTDYGLGAFVSIYEEVPFSEMNSQLNKCDVLISHFNFKGKWPHNCSIKHMEYMAVGKPVVATDVGEVNFAIEHGKCGFLVEEGDVEGFSTELLRLLQSETLRRRFGSYGRQIAEGDLKWVFGVRATLKHFFRKAGQ